MDNNLDQKRQQLLDKYKSLFIQKTGFNGVNLDNYVNKIIAVGEQYYGSNFVEDILREKRDDSILWLIDEISRYSWLDSRNLNTVDNSRSLPAGNPVTENLENTLNGETPKGLPAGSFDVSAKEEQEKGQMLANAFGAVANQKAEQEKGQMLANAFGAVANQKAEKEKEAESVTKVLEPVKNENTSMLDDVFVSLTGASPRNLSDEEKTTVNDLDSTRPLPELTKDDAVIPSTAKVGKRKEAPKGLINKFKEKWQDPKFKKKLLIGGIAIAVIGIGVIAATAISQIMSTQSLDTNMIINANHLTSSLIDGLNLDSISSNIDTSAVSGSEYMDYTVNTGDTIYSNATDAVNSLNGDTASQWYNSTPQGIYDTANNTWVDTSNVDFNSVEDMKQFMDGDHAVVQGGNGDLDGFRPIDESMIKSK